MSKVVVLATGGTIASRLDPARGSATAVASGDELVAAVRARGLTLPEGVAVEVEQFCNVNSFNLDLETVFDLCKRVRTHLADPQVSGAVVTQGTDTLEESAYLADLVVGSDKPVVFTGAQRRADEADADGPRNLADAIRVAASEAARGLGAVVVFEQEIHAARDVTKRHASRLAAFWSSEHGKLGEVDGERLSVQRRPLLRRSFAVERIEPRIDLVKLVLGSDARFLRHALADGAKGLVVEGYGRGNANRAVLEGIAEALAQGVPVLVASRCPEGRVKGVYGDGGGADVVAAGALHAGDLTGVKARLLLAVLLGEPATADLAETLAALAG